MQFSQPAQKCLIFSSPSINNDNNENIKKPPQYLETKIIIFIISIITKGDSNGPFKNDITEIREGVPKISDKEWRKEEGVYANSGITTKM